MNRPRPNGKSLAKNDNPELNVMVLQGGGALGAYQAGAYAALHEAGIEPDWMAGISIGAINAAIIAGNPASERTEKLRAFWELITSGLPEFLHPNMFWGRSMFNEISAGWVLMQGAPGFFTPRRTIPALQPDGEISALSWYDTAPLEQTLRDHLNFDYLNDEGPRLSLGAVELGTANFDYFDSGKEPLGPHHVMASGALPPGFPPIEVKGKFYWDGGLVSNTPLQYVLDEADGTPLAVFQLDLFPARGKPPMTILDVAQREKDVRYSSRTRLTTDRYRQLSQIQAAACRLRQKVGDNLADDPDMQFLCQTGTFSPVMLVHLIHRTKSYETGTKDYEFSRVTMLEHWEAGARDVRQALATHEWRDRVPGAPGLTILDAGITGTKRHMKTEERT
jgi:NTE family protein